MDVLIEPVVFASTTAREPIPIPIIEINIIPGKLTLLHQLSDTKHAKKSRRYLHTTGSSSILHNREIEKYCDRFARNCAFAVL